MHHLHAKFFLSAAIGAIAILSGTPASAVTINVDYSNLGSVYQDSDGYLFGTEGPGHFNDVTSIFKADVAAGLNNVSSAILLPWTTTISFQLSNLKADNAVGTSLPTGFDDQNHISKSIISVDTGNSRIFLDQTPTTTQTPTADKYSDWTTTNASLGGGLVNISRFGQATHGGLAEGRYDLLTLIIHEAEHSLGFSEEKLFTDRVGSENSSLLDRMLTVPTSLSGLVSSYQVPFLSTSAHIDGKVNGGLFNNTVVADPGFKSGQRALATDLELEALCVVNGCTTAADLNLSVSAVPEPSTWAMLLASIPLLVGVGRRRKQMQA